MIAAPIAPIDWWRLDSAERVETLRTLSIFVPELVRRYALNDQVIPPCWYRHEALIQELLALYQFRNQNQFLPIAPPVAPKEFHYELQLVITRLRGWVATTGCNMAEHHEDRVQAWAQKGSAQCALWETSAHEFFLHELPDSWNTRAGNRADKNKEHDHDS